MKKLLSALLVLCMVLSLAGCGNKSYKEGVKAMENENWELAISYLSESPDYKDSAELIKECRKKQAVIYVQSRNYGDLIDLYKNVSFGEMLEEVDEEVFGALYEDIREAYNDYDDIIVLCDFCKQMSDFLVKLGYPEDDILVTPLAGMEKIRPYAEKYYQQNKWFVTYYPEINDLLNQFVNYAQAGQWNSLDSVVSSIKTIVATLMGSYGSDELTKQTLTSLNEFAEGLYKEIHATSQAEADKGYEQRSTGINTFLGYMQQLTIDGDEIQKCLDDLNNLFGTKFSY